ncbi:MAG: hypothetical protein ABFR95_04920 [Actinomycetota bacterium]
MTVQKADLEAKLREIEGVVTDVEDDAKSNARTIVLVVGAVAVGVVALTIWRSRRSKIRVEVYS